MKHAADECSNPLSTRLVKGRTDSPVLHPNVCVSPVFSPCACVLVRKGVAASSLKTCFECCTL